MAAHSRHISEKCPSALIFEQVTGVSKFGVLTFCALIQVLNNYSQSLYN